MRVPFVMHFGFADNELGFIIPGGMTIVISDDKKVGFSICSPFDNFDKKKGIENATNRLQSNPLNYEDYNPEWSYMDKIDYLMDLSYEIVSKYGGKQWRDMVLPCSRKEKYLNFYTTELPEIRLEEEDKGWFHKLKGLFGG